MFFNIFLLAVVAMAAVTSIAIVAFQFSSVCSHTQVSVPGCAALLTMCAMTNVVFGLRRTMAGLRANAQLEQ